MARTGKTAVPAPRNLTRGEAPFQEFANSNPTPGLSRRQEALLLNDRKLLRTIRGLTPEDQVKFVEQVDQAHPTIDLRNAQVINALGKVCSATARLPTSAVLSTGLKKRGDIPEDSGGTTDIWRGECGDTEVAIKAFRIHPSQRRKEAKEILWKRVPIWRRLSHENILPFHGVDMMLFQLALVYDWERNGNINQYTASHPGASRPSLLFDVAKGLQYLHSLDIPHGDLKGANVIVDQDGHARLTEYGLAPINSNPSLTALATPEAVGVSRWMAPEIINPSHDANGMPVVESKPADVFAFAMFAVEVFTGKMPFEKERNEAIALRISRGGRPGMPENAQAVGLTDEMWKLIESCWQQDPEERPTMDEVVRRLREFVEHDNNNNNNNNNNNYDVVTERPQPTASLFRPMSGVRSWTNREHRRTPEAVQPRAKPKLRPRPHPTPPRWKKWVCGLF